MSLTRNEQVAGSIPVVGSSKNNELYNLYIANNPRFAQFLHSSENFIQFLDGFFGVMWLFDFSTSCTPKYLVDNI